MNENPGERRGAGWEHQGTAEAEPQSEWPQRPETTPSPFTPSPDSPGTTTPPALIPATKCSNCEQVVGGEPTCQFCGQVLFLPRGIHLATAGLRLGGYVLEGVLLVCTVVIGWLIWAFIVFQYGQTPAKQLLHMRVVYSPQARTARWWRMFFREFIAKTIIWFLATFTLFIPYFWLLWDRNRQELWDKMATTLVVSDPQDQLHPQASDDRAATR
ncbi:RDD family protein [Streptomyces europaeiscabiei]|uniref:RDD family protein n=1 Tax=Streptomyces europaeiscabiei TaxID=146819 RepID=UPI0038D42C8F